MYVDLNATITLGVGASDDKVGLARDVNYASVQQIHEMHKAALTCTSFPLLLCDRWMFSLLLAWTNFINTFDGDSRRINAHTTSLK